MSQTQTNKIATIEDKIAQLENQKKQLIQKQKEADRKARTKRLCSRMGHIESVLPDTINLTEEQFKAFIKRTLQGDFARKAMQQAKTLSSTQTANTKPQSEPQQRAPAAPPNEGGNTRSGV